MRLSTLDDDPISPMSTPGDSNIILRKHKNKGLVDSTMHYYT